MPRTYRILTDSLIANLTEFVSLDKAEGGGPVMIWDSKTPGFRVHVGSRQVTFSYFKQTQTHGHRQTTAKTLGSYPAMKVGNARKAALIEAGRVASGRITPGLRSSTKVSEAIDSYIAYLRTRKKGSKWPDNALSVARVHILPAFGNYPLRELSAMPAVVADWHKKISRKSPVAANHAARVLRAAYRRAARLDRTLPPHNPTSAVEFNTETRSQDALTNFKAWQKAWDKIESPVRRAFQKINLLCGARPGELARLRWADVLPKERVFVIRFAKKENDIRVVLSLPMVKALKLARGAYPKGELPPDAWVFPARAGGHIVKFDSDGLPAFGMMYRRTWRTVAADLGIDELHAHALLGHQPAGVSRGYVAKMMLASGQGMRASQRRVSAEIVKRLGIAL